MVGWMESGPDNTITASCLSQFKARKTKRRRQILCCHVVSICDEHNVICRRTKVSSQGRVPKKAATASTELWGKDSNIFCLGIPVL